MSKVQGQTPAPAKHAPAAAAPAAAKPATEPKEKKAAEPVVEYVTSAQLAVTLGIKSTTLRRWLRTLPQFQDGGYTRYKWEPTSPFLKEVKERYEKFAATEKEKQEKRLADAREKAEKKAADGEKPAKTKTKKAKAAPVEEETTDEDEEVVVDDEEGEELE